MNVRGKSEKIVVVNSGCDRDSCGTSIGFNNGWPHPLRGIPSPGNGSCPNGRIEDFNSIPTFCYTSLEAARDDHKLPPFVQLSSSGWKDPDKNALRMGIARVPSRQAPARGASEVSDTP